MPFDLKLPKPESSDAVLAQKPESFVAVPAQIVPPGSSSTPVLYAGDEVEPDEKRALEADLKDFFTQVPFVAIKDFFKTDTEAYLQKLPKADPIRDFLEGILECRLPSENQQNFLMKKAESIFNNADQLKKLFNHLTTLRNRQIQRMEPVKRNPKELQDSYMSEFYARIEFTYKTLTMIEGPFLKTPGIEKERALLLKNLLEDIDIYLYNLGYGLYNNQFLKQHDKFVENFNEIFKASNDVTNIVNKIIEKTTSLEEVRALYPLFSSKPFEYKGVLCLALGAYTDIDALLKSGSDALMYIKLVLNRAQLRLMREAAKESSEYLFTQELNQLSLQLTTNLEAIQTQIESACTKERTPQFTLLGMLKLLDKPAASNQLRIAEPATYLKGHYNELKKIKSINQEALICLRYNINVLRIFKCRGYDGNMGVAKACKLIAEAIEKLIEVQPETLVKLQQQFYIKTHLESIANFESIILDNLIPSSGAKAKAATADKKPKTTVTESKPVVTDYDALLQAYEREKSAFGLLKGLHEELQREHNLLIKSYENLESDQQKLAAQLKSAQEKLAAQQKSAVQAEPNTQQMTEQRDYFNQNSQKLSGVLTAFKEAHEALTNSRKTAFEEGAELEEAQHEVAQLKSQLQAATTQAANAKSELATTKKQVESLKTELALLYEKANTVTSLTSELNKAKGELQNANKKNTEQLNSFSGERRKQAADIVRLTQENTTAQERLVAKQAELDAVLKNHETLKQKNQRQAEHFKVQLEAAQSPLDKLRAEHAEQLKALQAKEAELNAQIVVLEKTHAEQLAKEAQKKADLDRLVLLLRTEGQEIDTTNTGLKRQVATLKEQLVQTSQTAKAQYTAALRKAQEEAAKQQAVALKQAQEDAMTTLKKVQDTALQEAAALRARLNAHENANQQMCDYQLTQAHITQSSLDMVDQLSLQSAKQKLEVDRANIIIQSLADQALALGVAFTNAPELKFTGSLETALHTNPGLVLQVLETVTNSSKALSKSDSFMIGNTLGAHLLSVQMPFKLGYYLQLLNLIAHARQRVGSFNTLYKQGFIYHMIPAMCPVAPDLMGDWLEFLNIELYKYELNNAYNVLNLLLLLPFAQIQAEKPEISVEEQLNLLYRHFFAKVAFSIDEQQILRQTILSLSALMPCFIEFRRQKALLAPRSVGVNPFIEPAAILLSQQAQASLTAAPSRVATEHKAEHTSAAIPQSAIATTPTPAALANANPLISSPAHSAAPASPNQVLVNTAKVLKQTTLSKPTRVPLLTSSPPLLPTPATPVNITFSKTVSSTVTPMKILSREPNADAVAVQKELIKILKMPPASTAPAPAVLASAPIRIMPQVPSQTVSTVVPTAAAPEPTPVTLAPAPAPAPMPTPATAISPKKLRATAESWYEASLSPVPSPKHKVSSTPVGAAGVKSVKHPNKQTHNNKRRQIK